MKQIFRLAHDIARERAIAAVKSARDGQIVTVSDPTRTLTANALLWALLHDLAAQVKWHGVSLSPEEYKDLLSAGLVKSKVVPNIEGNGFVILGQRTSKMTKAEFSDLIELVFAFGAEHGVVWSEERIAA